MERFAFIIHPMEPKRDIARKYPFVKFLPDFLVEEAARRIHPKMVSHITGIKSATGAEAEGWFIGCPLTPRQLLGLPHEEVYNRLVQCGEIAADLGAKIIGLGALTSVAGDGGITIAKRLPIAVTTGNSYTVATAVEGAKRGAFLMDTPLTEATVAVVGAAGSIGQTCATLLARDVPRMVLIGRDAAKLEPIAQTLRELSPHCETTISADVATGLRNADVIVTVTSAVDAVILPEHLKSGAVVCDVARPRDVSVRVAKERDDVLVIEGGVVAVPGDPQFNFHFGFPERTAYACMSETMMLALDGRYESFTLGKTVSVAQAEETQRLAAKHGFKLAGFRSFEKAVTEEAIARVRKAAGRNK
ncbi:MAG: shikimate dehydrogenase [Armatimonadetes bacterium]|nr:shikimate dehydrogenase [Armatimonadota bacterium]